MSHHLDSPLARQDPRLNITDHYVFDADASPDADAATVFVMNVRTSLAGDTHDDPFHPEARYEFKVHLDGSKLELLTYRFSFEPAENGSQQFRLDRLTGGDACEDLASGTTIARGHTGTTISTDEGGQVWAGSAVEPFFLDLSQLHEVVHAVQLGEDVALMRWASGSATDTFTGSTVRSIVLTVPAGRGEFTNGRHIATWSTAKLATDAGGWGQVGRTGIPMIWPIFRPDDSDLASQANQTHPSDDLAKYGDMIRDAVESVVRLRQTSTRPEDYAERLVDRLIPDLLPYEIGTSAQFGFSAINGRRLEDNAPEVMFSLVTNSAVPTGLSANDVKRSSPDFPFVVPAD